MIHVGIGYDVHQLVAGRKLVLGGVEIPHTKGLDGHSDADVLCHAIADAILGAMVPRFLWANKATAGGRESFRRFTGLRILDSTSMAISPLGEAYANFGELQGTVFMVVFGAGFAVFYRLTLRYCLKYPTFLFWIPLIFYQAVKAETELLVVMNQLVKGSVVAFGCHFLVERVFPTRIRNLSPVHPAVPLPVERPEVIA